MTTIAMVRQAGVKNKRLVGINCLKSAPNSRGSRACSKRLSRRLMRRLAKADIRNG